MECTNIVSSTSVHQLCLTRARVKGFDKLQSKVACWNRKELKRIRGNYVHLIGWKLYCSPVNLKMDISAIESKNSSDSGSEASMNEAVSPPLSSQELKGLLADSERAKLIQKLSEANRQNRFIKRELQLKEDALVTLKGELAVVELEIKALVNLAQEIANYSIPNGSRKINGKYIQSHLRSRLEAVQQKMEDQIKDVDAAQSRVVPLLWCGVAESVQVMGSFDGWSQGEHLSPEYTGSYATFSTTLMLRPGRYEIKFLVDGEWHLSPEYPLVGEGLMQNNLLVVE